MVMSQEAIECMPRIKYVLSMSGISYQIILLTIYEIIQYAINKSVERETKEKDAEIKRLKEALRNIHQPADGSEQPCCIAAKALGKPHYHSDRCERENQ